MFVFEFSVANKTHSGTKKQKYWTRQLPNGQNLSSDWASSKLHDSIVMVSHKTAAFCTEQCMTPSLFHNFKVSQHLLFSQLHLSPELQLLIRIVPCGS